MADIKPTRSELMKLKKKIKLAKSGYNLLKKKRDGLILDFFEILKEAKTLRQDLVEEYKIAMKKMAIARIMEGDLKIKSLAMSIATKPEVEVSTKNIMGVVVPKIEGGIVAKNLKERGYGVLESSAAIDEAANGYEGVIMKIIKAAEVETTMKKLLDEIKKTKRRVNALEFSVIPNMNSQEAFIKMRLEEMERENVFRMKRIKA